MKLYSSDTLFVVLLDGIEVSGCVRAILSLNSLRVATVGFSCFVNSSVRTVSPGFAPIRVESPRGIKDIKKVSYQVEQKLFIMFHM